MEILKYKEFDYVVRYPNEFSDDKKYPLVIYLHGAGGRGRDIGKLADHVFFKETEWALGDAVSIAPQCYADTWFNIFEQLQDFLEMVTGLDFVDPARVYLMGASMGGYGAWQMAMSRPELFAAVVPGGDFPAIVLLLIGNVVFLLYDYGFSKVITFYMMRIDRMMH